MLRWSYRLGPWSHNLVSICFTTVVSRASADGAGRRSSLRVKKGLSVVIYGHGGIIASWWACYRRSQDDVMGWRRRLLSSRAKVRHIFESNSFASFASIPTGKIRYHTLSRNDIERTSSCGVWSRPRFDPVLGVYNCAIPGVDGCSDSECLKSPFSSTSSSYITLAFHTPTRLRPSRNSQ